MRRKLTDTDKTAAVAAAIPLLRPLFIDVQSWDAPEVKSVEKTRQHAKALLTYPNPAEIVHALWRAVKELATPEQRRGRYRALNARRDRIIIQTVRMLCEQFDITQEDACEIVAGGLKEIWKARFTSFKRLAENPEADQKWFIEQQRAIDGLRLKASTIWKIVRTN
jgi:hypothetical protein